MKIYILGNKGMLGNYVYSYLKGYFDVVPLNRDQFDASSVNDAKLKKLFVNIKPKDVVINCIGAIKPQVDKLGDINAIKVNSVFPLVLSNFLEKKNVSLYHITTDCVFSGLKGKYVETDIHDVSDVYGRTKSLGEPKNCSVIRTSIIGEEKGTKRSFVEWVKSENGKEVNGFINHFWNGLTCLELAKILKHFIEKNIIWSGVKHLYTPNDYSKYKMVDMVSKIWNVKLKIKKVKAGVPCDRTLRTIYPIILKIPNLEKQLKEMKKFSPKLTNWQNEKISKS
jgi:dTDP-4-dehydrorhamnose reductase